jgi:lysophospholipase L1-like esterase
MSDQPNPNIPAHPSPFRYSLPHLAEHLTGSGSIKIVAIGSSTTAGEGGVVAYPYRLEEALRIKYVGRMIDVLNRGKSGDEARAELSRLESDVLDEAPALVIWQVGTNAVWKGYDLNDTVSAVREGIELLIGNGMDIVLMDPQYAPALLTSDKIEAVRRMVSAIAEAADGASAPVSVFRRFDLMRRWHEIEKISFDRMIDPTDPGRLHHSDWSARHVAGAVCDAIADGVSLAKQGAPPT